MIRKLYTAFIFIFIVLALVACATTGKSTPEDIRTNAYKALVVAAESYELTMVSFGVLAGKGIVKAEDIEKAKKYGRIYYDAYRAASIALYAYASVSNTDNEVRLSTMLQEMNVALVRLLEITQPYLERR